MLIRCGNNEALSLFYEKFKDYGKDYESKIKEYQENIERIKLEYASNLNEMLQSDFKKMVFWSSEIANIQVKLTNGLKDELEKFTQEALLKMYLECPYFILREVCYGQLIGNIKYIEILNNEYSSGKIFGLLIGLTEDKKNRLLELREFGGSFPIDNIIDFSELLPEVKALIEKSLTEDITDDFMKFIQENDIENVEQFKFHQVGVENQKVMDDSKKNKDFISNIFGDACGEYFTKDDVKKLKKTTIVISRRNK